MSSIFDLPKLVFPLFHRIYRYYVGTGWIVVNGRRVGQRIVRVTNRLTLESTLFNELRAKRRMEGRGTKVDVGECGFCRAEETTAEDVFGRVRGRHCVTASNSAKYDVLHGLVIFNEHDPFVWEEEKIRDFFEVSLEWIEKARREDERARYPFFMWNCLWRAGASVVHGHAHVLLSREPYSTKELYDAVRERYERDFGSDYFDDVFEIHKRLGLGFELFEVRTMLHLTPVKEKEVVMISNDLMDLPEALSVILRWYGEIGVESFNLAVFMPPLDKEDVCIARLVDRGRLDVATCDIGGMELLARTSVVSSDPFKLAEKLKDSLDLGT